MYRFLLFLLLLHFAVRGVANDLREITTINTTHGLSQAIVRSLLQDRRGFMWMGTFNGLNRFNGKNFTVIHPHLEGRLLQTNNRIMELAEDKHGYIWIRTYANTMFCYDPIAEQMVDYAPADKDKSFSKLLLASNGDVWLWGNQGCCRVRYEQGSLQAWKPNQGPLAEGEIGFLHEDKHQNIWIRAGKRIYRVSNGRPELYESETAVWLTKLCRLDEGLLLAETDQGLQLYDEKRKRWQSAASLLPGVNIRNAHFLADNKNHLWIYNKSGVLWRHKGGTRFEPLKLIPAEMVALIDHERFFVYHDSKDILWISTYGNGLFALNSRNGALQHFTADKELPTNYLHCITEDNQGEIWVGTDYGGVVKIARPNPAYDLYYPVPNAKMERDNTVRLIYEDSKGDFWYGTRGGNLYVCNADGRLLYTHRTKGGVPFTMAEDTLGNKWVGTRGGGVLIFSPKNDRVIEEHSLYKATQQGLLNDNIFTILRDNKQRMWLASFGGGLQLAERQQGKVTFRQFLFGSEQRRMLRGLIQDQEGLLWCATNEGIVVCQPDELIKDEKAFTLLNIHEQSPHFVEQEEVKVIYEDSKGRIWAGSNGGGLHLLQRGATLEQSTFRHFDRANGLADETVQAILEDAHGDIWLSTESGISRFNPSTERFENFLFTSTRRAVVFNELASWKKRNGELMFGSNDGVYTFRPDEMKPDSYAPPVMITGLLINGHTVKPGEEGSPLKKSITDTQEIVLEAGQNSFSLECTMLNYHTPALNKYAYYLEGYEKSRNPASHNNVAVYRNVPPGSYTFKVKGCNSSDVWNEEETTLRITILPPWWRSSQAMLLYAIAGILLAYTIFRIISKMQRLRMDVQVEKQLTEYKLHFFTNISHEFRSPLTIIGGAIEDMAGRKEVTALAGQQLVLLSKSSKRLMRLIDQLLEFRRLQNGKPTLNTEPTEVERFLHDIYRTFADLAEKKHIEYSYWSNAEQRKAMLDRSKVEKMVYNLLSNAFKYTPEGGKIEFSVDCCEEEGTLFIHVADSGPGIPAAQRKRLFMRFEQLQQQAGGTGIGLHLTSELAKEHKGCVEYSDAPLGGACFTITLPLDESDYSEPEEKPLITDTLSITEIATEGDIDVEKSFKDYKIMIIDDEEEVRQLITMQLNQYFTTVTAANGIAGLQRVAEEQPDLVICDIMMPEMDGFAFTRKMKEDFEISHIPVVLLTAYASEEHRLKGIKAGADAFISKPFSINYLLARVIKLIEQREKLRRKFLAEPGVSTPIISTTDRDKAFLEKIHLIIEKNMANVEFKLESYAPSLKLGRTAFFNKIKNLVGYSPNEYVRILRMKKAAELLLTTEDNISEISSQVGIDSIYYFSRCFKEFYGVPPSKYRKEKLEGE